MFAFRALSIMAVMMTITAAGASFIDVNADGCLTVGNYTIPGHDISYAIPAPSAQACCNMCLADGACEAVVYHPATTLCQRKSGGIPTKVPSSGAVLMVRAPPPTPAPTVTPAPTAPLMKVLWNNSYGGVLPTAYVRGNYLINLYVNTLPIFQTSVYIVDLSTGVVVDDMGFSFDGTGITVMDEGQLMAVCSVDPSIGRTVLSLMNTTQNSTFWEIQHYCCIAPQSGLRGLYYAEAGVIVLSNIYWALPVFALNATNGKPLWGSDPSMFTVFAKIPKMGMYFVGVNVTETDVIQGLDVITGQVALTLDWNFTSEGDVRGGSLLGNGYSTPLVFVPPSPTGTRNGTILVFDPISGKLIHRFQLVMVAQTAAMPGDAHGFLITVPSNRSASGLTLVKLTWSGKVVWTYDFVSTLPTLPPVMMYDRTNTNILYMQDNGRVMALDQRSGRIVAESYWMKEIYPGQMIAGSCGIVAYNITARDETQFFQLPQTVCP